MSEFDEHIIGGPQFYHESKVLDRDRRTAVKWAAVDGFVALALTGVSADTALTAGSTAERVQTMTHQAIESAANSNYRVAIILGVGALGSFLATAFNMHRANSLEGALALSRLHEASRPSLQPVAPVSEMQPPIE